MEPFDDTVAIKNSHQHNGTRSRATRRLAVSPVSSEHTLVILQPLDDKGKIAGQKVIKHKAQRRTRNTTELINPLKNKFILNR